MLNDQLQEKEFMDDAQLIMSFSLDIWHTNVARSVQILDMCVETRSALCHEHGEQTHTKCSGASVLVSDRHIKQKIPIYNLKKHPKLFAIWVETYTIKYKIQSFVWIK